MRHEIQNPFPAGATHQLLPPVAVLGAGRIGQTIALDCLQHGAAHVVLIDVDAARARDVTSRWSGYGSIEGIGADLSDPRAVAERWEGIATVVSAVPYRLNLALAREAIVSLDPVAKRNNVSLIPDAGLQPGLGNILAGELYRRLGGAEVLRVLVGGLPQKPEAP